MYNCYTLEGQLITNKVVLSRMTVATLSFQSLLDLQSRLVLLPRIEEEGIGAVVANYSPTELPAGTETETFHEEKKSDDDDKIDKNDTAIAEDTKNDNSTSSLAEEEISHVARTSSPEARKEGEKQKNANIQETSVDDEEENVADSPNTSKDDGRKESPDQKNNEFDSNETIASNVIGKVLIGIEGLESPSDDWLEQDFSQILACIREARYPISLQLGVDIKEREPQLSSEQKNNKGHKDEQKTMSTLNTWSSWAAAAASNAKEYASAQATALAAARSVRLKKDTKLSHPPQHLQSKPKCSLFLQSDDGDYSLVASSSKDLKVTTASILSVRRESSLPCPRNGYRFQWLRSRSDFESPQNNCNLIKCEVSSISLNGNNSNTKFGKSTEEDIEWTILAGATNSIYQPNATDVGHRLKCLVSIESEVDEGSCVEDNFDAGEEEIISCECPFLVSADTSLFNGSRQALSRGAQFGNLVGCGTAAGRTFSIQINIAISSEDKSMSSATKIFQCSGPGLESTHSSVIRNVSAIANPINPKEITLIFPLGLPKDSSMLLELSSGDHYFKLTAPNRITRESILFALGIANYSGEPGDLTETTVLYPSVGEYSGVMVKSSTSVPPQEECNRSNLEFQTSPEVLSSSDGSRHPTDDMNATQNELRDLRMKLARRDKEVHDLKNKILKEESTCQMMQVELSKYEKEAGKYYEESKQTKNALRAAEKRVETLEANEARMEQDHAANISTLEKRITSQSDRISELEKVNRSLQNEKAVITAAVEARDNKLDKMKEMETAFDELSVKVTKGDSLRLELTDMAKRYEKLCQDLENVAKSENECKDQLEETQKSLNELYQNLESEISKKEKCEKELENLHKTSQHLKAERNSFKQKAESLTKEIGRLCRGGRTLREVEMMLSDEESRRTEIEVLRSQKKKAIEESQQYRTAYEQQLVAQLNMGVDGAAVRALEQNAELERVVSELTEYVTAKEMQLETMKQVNNALTVELKDIYKSNMEKNEV